MKSGEQASTSKVMEFEALQERLGELYAKVDCLMADKKDVSLIKARISSANSVCAEMERIVLREVGKERKAYLSELLKRHHEYRVLFEERVASYFIGKMSKKEISRAVSAPPTLRSRASVDMASKKSGSVTASKKSGSVTSSVWKAKLVAKEELAKLKLKHLKDRQHLERQILEDARRQENEIKRLKKVDLAWSCYKHVKVSRKYCLNVK